MIQIELVGTRAANAALSVDILALLEAPISRSVLRMQQALQKYPPPIAPGHWRANTSPAQRRAFFAKLRRGEVSGHRTGNLGRGWTATMRRKWGGLEGKVSNQVPYAMWVQADATQSRFHRNRWQTDRAVLALEEPVLEREVSAALRRGLP